MDNQHFDADRSNQAATLTDLVARRKRNEAQRNPVPMAPQPVVQGADIKTDMPVQETVPAPVSPPTMDEAIMEDVPPPVDMRAVVHELKLLRAEVGLLRQLIQKGVSNL